MIHAFPATLPNLAPREGAETGVASELGRGQLALSCDSGRRRKGGGDGKDKGWKGETDHFFVAVRASLLDVG
jgi:hypothetical protein